MTGTWADYLLTLIKEQQWPDEYVLQHPDACKRQLREIIALKWGRALNGAEINVIYQQFELALQYISESSSESSSDS